MNDITGPHKRTWASKHPKEFRKIVEYSILFLLTLASDAFGCTSISLSDSVPSAIWRIQVTEAAQPTKPPQSPDFALADPCTLKDVVCGEENAVIKATVTTYQAVAGQTDSSPCQGAMPGIDFCHPTVAIVANNCLELGTVVSIRGKTYLVADRMNPRFDCDHFDILTTGDNFTLNNEPITIL